MKETEREVVRLGRELAAATIRIGVLEEKVGRLMSRLRVADTERAQRRHERAKIYARQYRRIHQDQLRAYNREWMRRYRERRKAA